MKRGKMFFAESEETAVKQFIDELTNKIVGQTVSKIEKVNYDTHLFTLGNGETFKVIDCGDCCAFGELTNFTTITGTENVITSLKLVENDNWFDTKKFSIFLLSAMEEVLEIEGAVNEGTGYYSFGWELTINV